jgi:uncharacterized OB-fold protein
VYTYTWVEHPPDPSLSDVVPYNVAVIELDGVVGEPVRIVGSVLDADRAELVVGLPVTVEFTAAPGGARIPVWVVARP